MMRGGRYSGGTCGVRLDVRRAYEGGTNSIRRGAEGVRVAVGVAKRDGERPWSGRYGNGGQPWRRESCSLRKAHSASRRATLPVREAISWLFCSIMVSLVRI